MNTLYPIIRRKRRPLILPEEPRVVPSEKPKVEAKILIKLPDANATKNKSASVVESSA